MPPRVLEPTPGQAHSWLEEELRSATYHPTSLLDRLLTWVQDRLADAASSSSDRSLRSSLTPRWAYFFFQM